MDKKKKSFRLPSMSFKIGSFGNFNLPILSRLKLPLPGGVYLGGGKLILVGFSAIGIGFLASTFVMINSGEKEIIWPQVGAVYDAPSLVGAVHHNPEEPSQRSMTLQLNIGQGERISEILLKDLSLGKDGITNAILLTGTSTTDVLVIETLTIRDSSFPTFDIADSDVHTIIATSSVQTAGHTVSPTLASSTDAVSIGGTRNAVSYKAEGGTVDRVIIRQSTTGGDVFIKKLTIDNVHSYIGQLNLENLSVGTLLIENSKFGDDGDVDNDSDFTINESVNVKSVTESIEDAQIYIR
ncbi:hypothetical protein [uncultured Mediterranean phage uvDeep-CGR2-KM18-C74]|nr:hypothetical protein [uncultured Mediterranean phage uvDeep-CGR2-KM18-C74]